MTKMLCVRHDELHLVNMRGFWAAVLTSRSEIREFGNNSVSVQLVDYAVDYVK